MAIGNAGDHYAGDLGTAAVVTTARAEFPFRGQDMTDREPIHAPDIQGFQVYSTALPTQKMLRFVTVLGSVEMMASKKWMLDIGRAMTEAAEGMIEPS
jgi:hypothetical protein